MNEQRKARKASPAPESRSDTDTLAELGTEMIDVASRIWGLQQPGQFLRSGQDSAGRINGRLLDDASAITGRIMAFGSRRFREDVECMNALARCRSPEEVLDLQRKWIDTAIDDYRRGGSEIYDAGIRLFTDSMKAAGELAGDMLRHDPARRS